MTEENVSPELQELETPWVRRKLIFFFLIMFVGQYWVNIFLGATNTPWADDFTAILHFAVEWGELSGSEKIESIFRLHYVHCIAVQHVITAVLLECFSEVNFCWMIYIGNFMLLPTVAIITLDRYRAMLPLASASLVSVAIPAVLLQTQASTLMFWPMAVTQHYICLFFSVLAFRCVTREDFLGATFSSLLALASSGGGIATVVVVGLYLLRHLNWRAFMQHILANSMFYLLIYKLQMSKQIVLPDSFSEVVKYVQFIVSLSGSCFDITGNTHIGFNRSDHSFNYFVVSIGGILIIGVGIRCLLRVAEGSKDMADWLGIYCGLTIILIATGRYASLERTTNLVQVLTKGLSARYRIYSMILFVIAISWLFETLKNKKSICIAITLGILLQGMLWSIACARSTKGYRNRHRTMMNFLNDDPQGKIFTFYEPRDLAEKDLKKSIEEGIFIPRKGGASKFK